ncbi:zinc homeostasis factor, putative [Entamoeba invadens IP1]|uniref:Zinc homeostasis factor, putative n=1 Tax=Entamoeba invadens IP1 TaxID=370355 RepID=L7FMP7_ENTIV|nr:zinc homeostasis factor, putative [Entamoeba invadens IP1]ELP92208.1 zinc homeostasis factor, putative [Entamoeba invadens IP1]|eukprot:XP_004258979.1 zinc homeostasis factor, putative [Entamoeba invadens IP1]
MSGLLTIILIFFICELVTGIVIHSLALLADAFHMLSDLTSQIIGLIAILLSKKKASPNYSYGYFRAEILGALTNGIFLLSVGLFIFLEAVERFIQIQVITSPVVMLVVAILGLLVNVGAMFLFHDHDHHHVGHSHDHVHGLLNVFKKKDNKQFEVFQNKEMDEENTEGDSQVFDENVLKTQQTEEHPETPEIDVNNTKSELIKGNQLQNAESKENGVDIENQHHHKNLNIRGVFLHVMCDALGSFVAVIVALGVLLIDGDWKYYLDPSLSLVVACVVMTSGMPLVKSCVKILMQSAPHDFSIEKIQNKIVSIKGIAQIQEVHVWQLANDNEVATVNIEIKKENKDNVFEIVQNVKRHHMNYVTVQPEI